MKFENQIVQHIKLLDHSGYGVTELRKFKPNPLVAYADGSEAVVRLCREMNGKISGIYVGVQPRPLDLFDNAPNCWRLAVSSPHTNCACDRDIEFITACYFDIDVVYRLIRSGELEAVNIVETNGRTARRGHYRIKRSNLKNYLKAKKVKPLSDEPKYVNRSRRFPKVKNHLGL